MSTPDPTSRPEFAVAVRGYDRAQVDDYLDRLHRWLADADARTATAEAVRDAPARDLSALRDRLASAEQRAGAPTPESMSAFGERIGQLLQGAVDAAEELRARAVAETDEQRRALAAERERVLAQARAEAEQVLDRARRREQQIADNIAKLATKRSAALGELGRLQQHLAALIGDPNPLAAAELGHADGSGHADAGAHDRDADHGDEGGDDRGDEGGNPAGSDPNGPLAPAGPIDDERRRASRPGSVDVHPAGKATVRPEPEPLTTTPAPTAVQPRVGAHSKEREVARRDVAR